MFQACCLDSVCTECLTKMDTATSELRMRAGMLAKREAERVELLERAEIAWRDLELGYQRRLMLAEEKEIDLTKQVRRIYLSSNRLSIENILLLHILFLSTSFNFTCIPFCICQLWPESDRHIWIVSICSIYHISDKKGNRRTQWIQRCRY